VLERLTPEKRQRCAQSQRSIDHTPRQIWLRFLSKLCALPTW
jgi:hypothetical protein